MTIPNPAPLSNDNSPDLRAKSSSDELKRIASLVRFARASALDLGEHSICVKLLEVEEILAKSMVDRRV